MTFYTYFWLREDGTPYYVGKGTGNRFWNSRPGHRPPTDRARILIQEFPSEADALAAEIFLIAFYGRKDNGTGILRNRTDGGDGISGYRHTCESRALLSLAGIKGGRAGHEGKGKGCSEKKFAACRISGPRGLSIARTPEHQSAAGRRGGSSRSEKKLAALAANRYPLHAARGKI
jgi:hypothetical protein